MDRGGIQSWLMHFLRTVDRQHYHMDFLVHGNQPRAYDREIVQLGSRLLHCSEARRPWRYAQNFARALRTESPYDVVHSHVYAFTGFVMWLAALQRVPLRIAHVHTDRRVYEAKNGIMRKCRLRLMKSWIRRHAVVKIAASNDAAEDLFGPKWKMDPAVRIIHCGIDLAPFRAVPDACLRASLGLPPDALVIGHVGRFVTPKNHAFLVEVAAEAMKLDHRIRLLLIGDGPLRHEIIARAGALGITERVHFAGERDDVPAIMGAAMDVFVFPSLHEGLGLVLVEAQATGLPCLIADRVPREADVVPGLVWRLPLEQGPAGWANHLLQVSATPRVKRAEAFRAVERSTFNITRSVRHITRIYDGET
jgi:glycosyltransferase involved in cell wall biosynthesis